VKAEAKKPKKRRTAAVRERRRRSKRLLLARPTAPVPGEHLQRANRCR
jgi:hypothetical protein